MKKIGLVVFSEGQKIERYVDWLEANGFSVVKLSGEVPMELLKEVEGVVFPGGGDVHPSFYNAPPICVEKVDKERDEFELSLFKRVYETDLPVLGICRGIQLINVALGGTLIQDIEELMGSMIRHRGDEKEDGTYETVFHYIDAVENSLIEELIGKDSVKVNSSHHQAVDLLGKGLRQTAFCISDGVLEALEGETRLGGKILGVQWHPERTGEVESPLSDGLLKKLFE